MFLVGTTLFGQTILFTESFENGGVIPAGWSNNVISGSAVTFITSGTTGYPAVTVTPYNGSYEVFYNSYSISSGGSTLLARTANTSTVGYTTITVDFAMYHDNGYNPSTGEGITPEYSIDNGTTWTAVGGVINRYSATNGWVVHTISLPANANGIANLRIAFLFTSQFGNNIFMDFAHINGVPAAAPPTVTTTAATAILAYSATLNGTVNANNASTTVTFQYGLTVAYGNTVTAAQSPVSGNSALAVSGAIAGLTANTLYHFRCVGVNSGGTTNGNDMTFTTANAPPIVVTTAATAVLFNTATLNGTVNPNGASSTVNFDYGLTVAYGSNVAGTPSPLVGNSAQAVSANIVGLTPGTLYHFRVNGVNAGGTTNGNDMTFTTSAMPPTVVTTAATGIVGTSATLNGTINPNGAPTTSGFDYGLTLPYTLSVGGVPLNLNGNTVQAVSASLAGLTNNSVYHFRIKGTNAGATAYGNDLTFIIGCPISGASGAITGPTQVCQGGNGYVYSVATIPNATGYIWNVPVGGSIISGANTNSITVNFAYNAAPGYMMVYGTAPCGNGAPAQLAVNVNPPAVPTLSGQNSVCVNSFGKVYTTEAGMSNYVWTVGAGGTITAGGGATNNTVTVTWNTAGVWPVTVNYSNANGCFALSPTVYNVTVNALPVPTIAGPSTACTTLPYTYTTQAGMSAYVWTISGGGTITSGGTTNTISVLWNAPGAQSLTVNYNNAAGCTAATATTYAVTVNTTTVPIIAGAANVCVNSGYYTYTTQPGMTGYTWTISPGGTIYSGSATSAVTVTWPTAGAQWVRVNFTNPSGCSPASPTEFDVTVSYFPGNSGSIVGTSAVCGGATGVAYSVGAINNAVAYVWTLPAGATISSGANTNSITVDYADNASNGNITVYGNNACGNGAVSPPFAITVTDKPNTAGAITGMNSVCQGVNGVEYSIAVVTGATGYSWSLPTGASIATGDNTNDVTVNYSMSAASGTIKVFGTNSCGNGDASPALAITVQTTPPAPTITNDGPVLTSDATSGNQWYLGGNAVTGATSQTYTAIVNGIYTDVVTLGSCASAASNPIDIINIGINKNQGSSVSIYPVPNDGKFIVSITNASTESYTLSVLNSLGIEVYLEKDINVSGTLNKVVDLRPVPSGIYSVIIRNNYNEIIKKIVVNK